MSLLTQVFTPGDEVQTEIAFRKDGVLFDPFIINSVTIYDTSDVILSTYETSDIDRESIGLYYVTYNSSISDKVGGYKVVWNFQYESYSTSEEAIKYFFLETPEYDTSYGENYAFTFAFNLLNSTFYIGEKRFVRVNVEELYNRTWNGDAQMKVICYHDRWNIETIQDWQDCFWENEELISLINTTDLKNRYKYFIQIRLNTNNGETILSPQMKIKVIDDYKPIYRDDNWEDCLD